MKHNRGYICKRIGIVFLFFPGLFFSFLPVSPALQIETIYKYQDQGLVVKGGGVTFTVQNADIQSVLRALARQKGLNIVTSPDVTGTVSVYLRDASLQEALDAVITMNGFHYVRKGNILFVTKGKDGANEDLVGREVKTFRFNYVDVEKVVDNIRDILSPSAVVSVYQPDKTLIVEDSAERLARLEKVLKNLDTPPRQVLIEAKILEVRLNDDTSFGIDWNLAFSHFETSGKILTQGFAKRPESAAQGLFFTTADKDFSAFLDALQVSNQVNTLSTPKLLVLDHKEAKIIVGGKLGYFVTTATNTTVLQTVEFLEIGTQLHITPSIMDDGNIIMEIHPEVSDGTITAGLPTETTTEVTTNLIARDGRTIFIGGLIRGRKEDRREQVPGLGCLPGIGLLFGRTTNTTQKTEIVVLITPHILSAAPPGDTREIRKIEESGRKLNRKRSIRDLVPGLSGSKIRK